MSSGHNRLTQDRLAFIETLLDEGWSFRQIELTHGHRWDTLNKYFPNRGMNLTEAAKLGAMARKVSLLERK